MDARVLLFSILLVAPGAHAGALDLRHVPAEAPWVLHVDLEALAGSAILRELHAAGIRIENEFDLDDVKRDFGLDPYVDLKSLTLHGVPRSQEYVCIVAGTDALAAAWTRQSARGARAVRIAGCEVLQPAPGSEPCLYALLPGRAGERRVAVVAQTEATLRATLAVVQGEKPSLVSPPATHEPPSAKGTPRTDPRRLLQARLGAGSLVFAAGVHVARFEDDAVFLYRALQLLGELADVPRESEEKLALHTRALEFELAEIRGELQIRLVLDTPSPAGAKELEQLLRDAVARSSAATEGLPVAKQASELLAALHLETAGTRLLARYRYPAKRLVDDLRTVEEGRGIRPRH